MLNIIKIILLTILITILPIRNCYGADIIVKTSDGLLKGSILKTQTGKNINSFRGIRYAKPPVGERRFQAPEPIDKYNGIYDATEDKFVCPQKLDRNTGEISEDCLFLNVYSRNLTAKTPVLVYIHGGGFLTGSGHSKHVAGPQYLLEHDIVLVTLNYRLGALGFLTTQTKEAPGNYGFKDQVLALKWIKENIHAFGGNPNSITLLGQSAGSMSVTLHMVSPMSKHLFDRVILMSGSATSELKIDSVKVSHNFANLANCIESNEISMNCLRNISWQKVIEISENERSILDFPWYFVIENDYGQERFITDDVNQLFINGNFSRVPIIAGLTKTEFELAKLILAMNKNFMKNINENFDEIAPDVFLYEKNTNRSHEISQAFRKFYFNNENITKSNLDQLGYLYSDCIMNYGVHRIADLARQFVDVYFYELDFIGRYSHADGLVPSYERAAIHSDDLGYLFLYDGYAPEFKEEDPEFVQVQRYTNWFSSFTRTGNPNSEVNPDQLNCVYWEPSNKTHLITLYNDKSCKIGPAPIRKRMQFWDDLFPLTKQNFNV